MNTSTQSHPTEICQAIKLDIESHSHFRLSQRLHLPNPDRVTADGAVLATLFRGLIGRDILNVCVNAIHAGSLDDDAAKWVEMYWMIVGAIRTVRLAKVECSGEKQGALRTIGLQPGRSKRNGFDGGRVELNLDLKRRRGVRGLSR